MRFVYDESVNSVRLYLRDEIEPGDVTRGTFIDLELQNSAVTASLDEAGHPLLVEFMGADQIFTNSMRAAIAASTSGSSSETQGD